jgi:hypothetical protein
MIVYALACEAGHGFESWFRDSAAYDDHSARALVACPTCGSTAVKKTIMAPSVVRAVEGDMARVEASEVEVARLGEEGRELRGILRRFREAVLAEGHDVGQRFAVEARRMHDGEAPTRQIYGQASLDEVRDLLDDGIAILPLPPASDELN